MSENENNFESLRRLLALKNYEIPPPGYFDNFSREVTARIRAEDGSRTANVSSQLSWLSRLLSAFEAKPAFAGGFACHAVPPAAVWDYLCRTTGCRAPAAAATGASRQFAGGGTGRWFQLSVHNAGGHHFGLQHQSYFQCSVSPGMVWLPTGRRSTGKLPVARRLSPLPTLNAVRA